MIQIRRRKRTPWRLLAFVVMALAITIALVLSLVRWDVLPPDDGPKPSCAKSDDQHASNGAGAKPLIERSDAGVKDPSRDRVVAIKTVHTQAAFPTMMVVTDAAGERVSANRPPFAASHEFVAVDNYIYSFVAPGMLREQRRGSDFVAPSITIEMRVAPSLTLELVDVPVALRESHNVFSRIVHDRSSAADMWACDAVDLEVPVQMSDNLHVFRPIIAGGNSLSVYVAPSTSGSDITLPGGRALPTRRFDAAESHVRVSLAELASQIDGGAVTLNLQFPFPHPSGRVSVRLQGSSLRTIAEWNLDRATQQVLATRRFEALPRDCYSISIVNDGAPLVYLAPFVLAGRETVVDRSVVAEGSIRSIATNAGKKTKVVVWNGDGEVVDGGLLDSAYTWRCAHLAAGEYYVQAIAMEESRCSLPVAVHLNEYCDVDIPITLEPGAIMVVRRDAPPVHGPDKIRIAKGGLETACFLGRKKEPFFWLPFGAFRAEYEQESMELDMRRDVSNSLDLRVVKGPRAASNAIR